MKFLKCSLFISILIFITQSCEKEYSLEDSSGTAEGTLKADGFGDCLPSAVNGIYKIDSTLGADNFIEVQVNFTVAGNYNIVSDTINGYSFKAADNIASPGLYNIRLFGTGKPLNVGVNNFTISFGGSQCDIAVTVVSAGTNIAVFTLGGSPGNCSGVTINGTYTAGIALTGSNTATLTVNVTAIGAYTLAAASTNGIFFTGSGTFTTLGPQSVMLNGLGTPIDEGVFNVTAINLTSTCTFSITVLPGTGGTGGAVCTLGGAPGNCTGVLLNGNYQVGVATTSANTATLEVNVTTIGTYTITTPTINGVNFSAIGSFTTVGAQTVVLTASGIPTSAGAINYPATVNTSTCTFSVTYTAAASPAVYTLQGAPGICTPASVSGSYAALTPLTSGNTVTIQANVATIGSYTITTNTANGISFSSTGVFSSTGIQNVILIGNGTPAASGTYTFSISGTSSCSFDVLVATAATDFITCKINGVFTTFNVNAIATLDVSSGFPVLSMDGENTTSPDPSISFGMAKLAAGNIVAGTYTVNQLATGIVVGCYYYDASGVEYSVESDPANQSQSPAFTLVITSITATRVIGTFTGPLKDNAGAGPGLRTITEGVFNLPIQ